ADAWLLVMQSEQDGLRGTRATERRDGLDEKEPRFAIAPAEAACELGGRRGIVENGERLDCGVLHLWLGQEGGQALASALSQWAPLFASQPRQSESGERPSVLVEERHQQGHGARVGDPLERIRDGAPSPIGARGERLRQRYRCARIFDRTESGGGLL